MADTGLPHQNGAVITPTLPAERASPAPENPTAVVPPAPRGPPLWKIHELPAPIRTFPLPSFYPNNPLSLFHVAYAWIAQILSPPREPAVIYEGFWSPSTRSVHIKDPKSIRALWEQGFYGKGHLSRSEPNWLKREQARKGAHNDHVAEVFTNKRREDRTQMKWERAKKEQEVIHRTRYEEARIAPVGPKELLALPNSQCDLDTLIYGGTIAINGTAVGNAKGDPPFDVADLTLTNGKSATLTPAGLNGDSKRPSTPIINLGAATSERQPPFKRRKSVRFSPKVESTTFELSDPPSPSQTMMVNGNGKMRDGILTSRGSMRPEEFTPALTEEPTALDTNEPIVPAAEPELTMPPVDKEHLQLTLVEAVWLGFGLGVLDVKDEANNSLSIDSLLDLARRYSYYPPRTNSLEPDDPFLINYVVYHHFRSLGWVTRPGIKFGCDWLLYHRGPAFSHAEFAIIVLPSYSNPYWKALGRDTTEKSWHWLHLVNRVQSTALKTLVLVYVDVPAPSPHRLDIPSLLKQYKIREVMVKRWLINRNRD
ncbi:tRNA intron endonuclease [Seiridium cupressi]